MEKQIIIKNEYNSLGTPLIFLKNESPFESFKSYDIWEHKNGALISQYHWIKLKRNERRNSAS